MLKFHSTKREGPYGSWPFLALELMGVTLVGSLNLKAVVLSVWKTNKNSGTDSHGAPLSAFETID
jgi:hypothetical protein